MKKHAIIPVFISHRGCPNDCVFCNQRKITARQGDVTPDDVENTIETWLSTLGHLPASEIEVAFFGGSFTGIPIEEQTAFLKIAKEYKDKGLIGKIHLSTRPDYINEEILDNLKSYEVDIIELGVQSLDSEVLKLSGRGHDAAVVYRSSQLIKDYGFTLGIQLMIGLPGDTLEKDIYSALETVKIGPAIARLYPTVVIPETALYDMYLDNIYQPLNEDDAVLRTKEMYKILDSSGINIIRVGLKSSDVITDEGCMGTFHPAFRQLVEGEIARESIESQIDDLYPGLTDFDNHTWDRCPTAYFISNAKCRNAMFGHKSCNRKYFENKYARLNIRWKVDTDIGLSLGDNKYLVIDEKKFKQMED